jgi:hypothetical protein
MMQGVMTIADLGKKLVSDDESALLQSQNQAAQTFVTGWVPQAVQQVARAIDANAEGNVRVRQVRDPDSWVQTAQNAVMQGIPGLRQQVPVRQDAFGRERGSSLAGAGVLSPARLTQEATDPMVLEMTRTGAAVARTDKRKGESQETFEARQAALGAAAARAVKATMANPQYRAIEQMDVAQLRSRLGRMQGDDGTPLPEIEKLDRMTDEQVRRRYQGIILDRVISRARESAGRRFPDPRRGRAGATLRSITR